MIQQTERIHRHGGNVRLPPRLTAATCGDDSVWIFSRYPLLAALMMMHMMSSCAAHFSLVPTAIDHPATVVYQKKESAVLFLVDGCCVVSVIIDDVFGQAALHKGKEGACVAVHRVNRRPPRVGGQFGGVSLRERGLFPCPQKRHG